MVTRRVSSRQNLRRRVARGVRDAEGLAAARPFYVTINPKGEIITSSLSMLHLLPAGRRIARMIRIRFGLLLRRRAWRPRAFPVL